MRNACALAIEMEGAKKKRRGFPRLFKCFSGPVCDYGIEIAAPELSYQYSMSVTGTPFEFGDVTFA